MTQEIKYRIKLRLFGWEPQLRYFCKDRERWVPLDRMGYWHQPDCFSTGEIKRGPKMSLALAKTAVARAKAINGLGIIRDAAS